MKNRGVETERIASECMNEFVRSDIERIGHHEKERGTTSDAPRVRHCRFEGLAVHPGNVNCVARFCHNFRRTTLKPIYSIRSWGNETLKLKLGPRPSTGADMDKRCWTPVRGVIS